MALSAAYRTGQRFGVNHLIDLLRGERTEKISQFQHDQLPTFGVGAQLDKDQWRSVYRQLVARGYLRVAVDQELTEFDAALNDAREVAFFPPMTGG